MKTIAGGFVLAIVLLAGGAVLWSQARLTLQMADAHQKLATLQYDINDALDNASSTWNPRRWQTGAADILRERAIVTYWLKRYDALKPMMDLTDPRSTKDP